MTADEKADGIIAGMTGGTLLAAAAPPVIDHAIFAAAVGGSVIAIATCYGVKISKEEAAKLVMEFVSYAGFAYAGGSLIVSLSKATGLAYAPATALEAGLFSAMSFAIGVTAKHYFKGERDPEKLKRILQAARKSAPKK